MRYSVTVTSFRIYAALSALIGGGGAGTRSTRQRNHSLAPQDSANGRVHRGHPRLTSPPLSHRYRMGSTTGNRPALSRGSSHTRVPRKAAPLHAACLASRCPQGRLGRPDARNPSLGANLNVASHG